MMVNILNHHDVRSKKRLATVGGMFLYYYTSCLFSTVHGFTPAAFHHDEVILALSRPSSFVARDIWNRHETCGVFHRATHATTTTTVRPMTISMEYAQTNDPTTPEDKSSSNLTTQPLFSDMFDCLVGTSSSSSSSSECALQLIQSEENSDERGLFLTRDMPADSMLLSIPLSSCLCDDSPPEWFYEKIEHPSSSSIHSDNNNDNDDGENMMMEEEVSALLSDDSNNHLHNPSQWATRLAASILDLQQLSKEKEDDNAGLLRGQKQWLSMLPNPSLLRASLPVHWTDETLSEARSCALELAVDSAYFARAEAVNTLMDGLLRRRPRHTHDNNNNNNKEEERRRCHDALDIVQTRTCRVDRLNGLHPPMRLLAPIFDFINHSANSNASFRLEQQEEEAFLVVRATRDMSRGEEVFLNYGENAHPAWKCLASYGFVPELSDEENDEEDQNVAEVFMDGVRYEVGRHTVPFEMVEAAAISLREEEEDDDAGCDNDNTNNEEENPLTPAVALRIAKRISDVGYDMLLENAKQKRPQEVVVLDKGEVNLSSAAEIRASSLAAFLRFSQHRVLLACAKGLEDYAVRSMGLGGNTNIHNNNEEKDDDYQ